MNTPATLETVKDLIEWLQQYPPESIVIGVDAGVVFDVATQKMVSADKVSDDLEKQKWYRKVVEPSIKLTDYIIRFDTDCF